MSLATVYCRAQSGVTAPLVRVEVHLSNGLPAFTIVGLPDTTIKESKERVRSALINALFDFPDGRITINLAPADLGKDGGRFDLPIAIGLLAASNQLPEEALKGKEFLGELSLDGSLRPIDGVLPAALQCGKARRQLFVPSLNADEACRADSCEVFAFDHLLELSAHLTGKHPIEPHQATDSGESPNYPDLADVQGQPQARRALEIAAAGGHNLLMFGSPGAGKTMLAKRLPGLLPPLSKADALEVAAVQSVAGQWRASNWGQRPFRAPHHGASAVALVGGGSNPRPGEISLAHRGVLFMDELPEFSRQVLEVLRQPLEGGEVHIARARQSLTFPARFQLVAAMNPCPCGYLNDPDLNCRCTPAQISRYRAKLSGPLLDRIDMHIAVHPLPTSLLTKVDRNEDSATVRQRVLAASELAQQRQRSSNSELEGSALLQACNLRVCDQDLLEQALTKLKLSARAYHRVLRVARTLADLAQHTRVEAQHLSEALSYRALDRQ